MKRLVHTWARRRRSTRMLVLRFDRSRRIDRMIDYFGERFTAVVVSDHARRCAGEQALYCEIVGETVRVLRRRIYFGPTPKYFARCDQADCQYSDENKPPCPLRPAMFDQGPRDQPSVVAAT
jgi:hypothetical protein